MKFLKPGLVLYFFITVLPSIGQVPESRLQELFNKMEDPRVTENALVYEFKPYVDKVTDTVLLRDLVNRLEKESTGRSNSFKIKMIHLKIWLMRRINPEIGLDKFSQMLDQYLKMAYETGDEQTIGIASWNYGVMSLHYQQLEVASTYCLKGIEVIEKIKGFNNIEGCLSAVGEILFRTREYRQCIYYSLRSSASLPDSSEESIKTDGRNMNTIGQAYYNLGMLDSALYYYNLSDEKLAKIHLELWQGINACFAGHAYFDKKEYSRAKTALRYAYQTNVNIENVIAAYSLCWLGRILIIENKADSAYACLNESLLLFSRTNPDQSLQKANYLQHTYFAMTELFRTKGRTDSFYFYNQQYNNLHDSLERVAAISNSRITQLRINNERDQFAIQTVLAEKTKEELKRNIIIGSISLIALVIIVVLNRQKKLLRYKEETVQYQKKVLETETISAKEQLALFTKNLVEKNDLLEQMQQRLNNDQLQQSQQQALNELGSQTILTEDDWTRFKILFEKNYPLFFQKLKQAAPEITIAEQRMAALTRLDLSSKHMASMLGISVDSVYKGRQRLRQRLNLATDNNLDQFITAL